MPPDDFIQGRNQWLPSGDAGGSVKIHETLIPSDIAEMLDRVGAEKAERKENGQ